MEPVRTCIGCRVRAPRSELIRVVSRDSTIVVDKKATMSGRGAWIHQTQECIDRAITRRAFGRALRVTGIYNVQDLENRLNG